MKADNIKIRKATKKDLKEVLEMELDLMDSLKRFDKDINLQKAKTPLQKLFSKLHRNFPIMLAEENKKIIGFVSASINKNTGYGYDYVWISDVFVKRQYRRRGITIKLLNGLMSMLRKRGLLNYRITSDISNKAAVWAWKKLGFKEHEITLYKKIR